MELRHLRYFLTVAKELHFGRAAERLFISQPPLSRQIKDLERELGVRLFDRKGKRVFLTEAGEYLKSESAKLLQHANNIQRQVRLVGGLDDASVSIGYVGSMVFSVIPSLVAFLKRQRPDWKIEIAELSTEDQLSAILDGRIDAGLTRSWGGNDLVEFSSLGHESLSLVFPVGYRLDGLQGEVLEQFVDLPYIGLKKERAAGLSSLILDICQRAGFTPLTVIETDQVYSILKLVSEGMGWSIIPTLSKSERFPEAIRSIELPNAIPFGLSNRKDETVPKVRATIDLIRDFFRAQ